MPDFVREIEQQRVRLKQQMEMDSRYDAKYDQVKKSPSKLHGVSFK